MKKLNVLVKVIGSIVKFHKYLEVQKRYWECRKKTPTFFVQCFSLLILQDLTSTPSITFTAQQISEFVSNPTRVHFMYKMSLVFQYLKKYKNTTSFQYFRFSIKDYHMIKGEKKYNTYKIFWDSFLIKISWYNRLCLTY